MTPEFRALAEQLRTVDLGGSDVFYCLVAGRGEGGAASFDTNVPQEGLAYFLIWAAQAAADHLEDEAPRNVIARLARLLIANGERTEVVCGHALGVAATIAVTATATMNVSAAEARRLFVEVAGNAFDRARRQEGG